MTDRDMFINAPLVSQNSEVPQAALLSLVIYYANETKIGRAWRRRNYVDARRAQDGAKLLREPWVAGEEEVLLAAEETGESIGRSPGDLLHP